MELYITISGIADLLSINKIFAYSLVKRPDFPTPIILGTRKRKWLRTAVLEWAANQTGVAA